MICQQGIVRRLVDSFGRPLNSLRISVTQKCNLECFYCHKEGEVTPQGEMTIQEISQIARAASDFGIRKVKLTGGEPLLREDIAGVVSEIKRYADEVSLTTNGVLLERYAPRLQAAGLKRVNVSLSSVTPAKFQRITGKPCTQQVQDGIVAAVQCGLYPVKINMVVLKGINVKEIPGMVDFAKQTGTILQLIEFQPIQRENTAYWKKFHYDLAPIEDWLRNKSTAVEENPLHKRKRYILRRKGGFVPVEVVRPMHNSGFCQNCTRLRVTSDGKLKPCLLRNDNLVDVVSLMRRGSDADELKKAFAKATSLREPYWKREGKQHVQD